MRLLISGASIFDGTGAAVRQGDVLVEDERIAAIDFGGVAKFDADHVIDGRGKVLMPGLIEAHAHLSWGSSVEKIYHEFILPEDELRVATWRNARVLLDYGFTSCYSAGALGESLEVELRDEIAAGKVPGPRLIASTIERSPEGADGVETGDIDHGRGPDAMRAFIAHCQELGIDSVKLLLSGEDALLPGSSQHIMYTEEEVAAAGDEAKRRGLWLAAHTQAAESIKMGLRNGVRVFYHCSWADEEALDMLEAKRDEIFVAPAIGIIIAILEATPPPHIDMSAMKESAKAVVPIVQKLVPELRRRGVRVLPGGDYGFPFNPNGRNARDLRHFVDLFGYTHSDALVAATKLGGELMGRGHELGLIHKGYLADMLLVDGDPTQDVDVLQDASRIVMIMKGGELYKSPSPSNTESASGSVTA